jgi:hypothetical protein
MGYSRSWVFYPFVLSTSCHLRCLLLKIWMIFQLTLTSIHTIPDPVPIYIFHQQGWPNIKNFSGTKVYNHLPTRIKLLSGDASKFKLALKKFLLVGSFYSIEEFTKWSTSGDPNTLYSCWLLNWLDWVPYHILSYSTYLLALPLFKEGIQ